MTNVMFLYNNLLDAATLTASAATAGYPAANLKNPLRTKVWKTTGEQNLVVDHGTAKAVNVVALTGYDWASAPGTLTFQANATDSWGAPSFSQALTWAAATQNGSKATIIKTFATQTYRYNRLYVSYLPGGSPTAWQLGRMFVGTYFQPTDNYRYERKDTFVDPSLIQRTIGGQEYADEIEKYRVIDCGFIFAGSDWASFKAMFNAVGISKDIFVAFDYDNEPNEMTVYGRFQRLPQASITRNRAFPLTLKESC
ncbi:MAG: hypothetical protein ACYC7J_18335 [Syntrophales bacterium]